jgi:hypothetical protein
VAFLFRHSDKDLGWDRRIGPGGPSKQGLCTHGSIGSAAKQHAASEPGPGERSQDESENGEAPTEPSLTKNFHEQVIKKAASGPLPELNQKSFS